MATSSSTAIRVRRDVWKLSKNDPWDPALIWYERAVKAMRQRPLDDPLGWRYQAAIHEYPDGSDPYADPNDVFPKDREDFWNQCQHGGWYFLPWHRMYLFHFERIVAQAIKDLGGPDDWALPYWNYSDTSNPDAMKLPPAFVSEKLPDGSPNALYVAQRAPIQEDGSFGMMSYEVDLDQCLRQASFEDSMMGTMNGFGGANTGGFAHTGPVMGSLEFSPHGSVHMAVGGDDAGGFMREFNTAALDPTFWLHHANIDRLWQVWRDRDVSHTDPIDPAWLASMGVRFMFHDATGDVVRNQPAEVVDTTAAPLLYRYEDVSDPLPTPAIAAVSSAAPPPGTPAELVGASGAVPLGAGPALATIPLAAPAGPAAAVPPAMRRVYLNFENVTASKVPAAYKVYVHPAGGPAGAASEGLLAGTLPMFGVMEASRAKDPHGGSGLNYVLDITDIVKSLSDRNQWREDQISVQVEPVRKAPDDAGLKIGRISVYYQ